MEYRYSGMAGLWGRAARGSICWLGQRCVGSEGLVQHPPKGGDQAHCKGCACKWVSPGLGRAVWVLAAPSPAFVLLLFSPDVPVVLARPLEPKAGRELQSVVLSCDFRPAPKAVQWYKGDTPLAPSEKFKMVLEGQMAELRILRLTPADAGVYRCQAGNAQSSAEVTVEGRELGRRGGRGTPLQGRGWLRAQC